MSIIHHVSEEQLSALRKRYSLDIYKPYEEVKAKVEALKARKAGLILTEGNLIKELMEAKTSYLTLQRAAVLDEKAEKKLLSAEQNISRIDSEIAINKKLQSSLDELIDSFKPDLEAQKQLAIDHLVKITRPERQVIIDKALQALRELGKVELEEEKYRYAMNHVMAGQFWCPDLSGNMLVSQLGDDTFYESKLASWTRMLEQQNYKV